MSKAQWWPAEGMIVDVESAFGHHEYKYTIQVRKWDGPLIQRAVKHKAFPPYDVGTKVRVQIGDDNQVRFDPSLPGEAAIVSTMTMSDQIAEASASFDQHRYSPQFDSGSKPGFGSLNVLRAEGQISFVTSGAAGDTPVAGGLAAALSAALKGHADADIKMIGPSGIEVVIDRAEISGLAQAVGSGDQDARKAAIARLRELRMAAMDQGGAAGSAGSGTPAGGPGTVRERLVKLGQLLSEGVLTQSEYDAQRQRIISEI
ncbi:MAG TPA: hypothetical protein VFQ44_19110 [Streptosporangiaceae bacterium]|nr:hypothetical protein [Streptosporangiaceae bacterium]